MIEAIPKVVQEPATAAELSALMRGDKAEASGSESEEDYDMHAITKAERIRLKKAQRSAKKKTKQADNEDDGAKRAADFSVNTADDRFFPMLRNSSNFGIDPTSSEFKPTEGMTKILQEQRRLRILEQEKEEQRVRGVDNIDAASEGKKKRSAAEVAPLVDRLKKKYKNK